MEISADFPEKLQFLFEPARFKVLYGGRDGAKSWGVARALLLVGASQPKRILCAREIQKSIADSVHKLLSDQVKLLGLEAVYEVQQTIIRGKPGTSADGTEITFHGLKHNIDNIKSVEGTDIVWVEEATDVSKQSWDKLEPTIRKDGSEIWITFNPELDTDETYKRFIINEPPGAKIVKVNYTDNPWMSKVLDDARRAMKENKPDDYLHIYEGHCKQVLDGAVFAEELREITKSGRVTKVPCDRSRAVHVFVDLGYSDNTSLWFMQKVALEYRILKSYQNRLKHWPHYLEIIQDTGYLIDTIWLPHDGDDENIRGKSIATQTREAGRKCRVIPRVQSKTIAINAAKAILPFCWFDQEGCVDGLQALRRYVWEDTAAGTSTKQPKHDANSHYADAFMEFAMGYRDGMPDTERAENLKRKLTRTVTLNLPSHGTTGWMGG